MRLELGDKGKILGIIRDGGDQAIFYTGSLFCGVYHSVIQYEI